MVMFVLSHEDVGLLILTVAVALAGVYLGYVLCYFEVGFPYPLGYEGRKRQVLKAVQQLVGSAGSRVIQ